VDAEERAMREGLPGLWSAGEADGVLASAVGRGTRDPAARLYRYIDAPVGREVLAESLRSAVFLTTWPSSR
jgi:hypothetical protein